MSWQPLKGEDLYPVDVLFSLYTLRFYGRSLVKETIVNDIFCEPLTVFFFVYGVPEGTKNKS